jgi:hypothetical protein
VSEEEAVLRYESLRSRCGVNGRPSQEGGLFVQRGLAAWMQTWASCTGPPSLGKTDAARVDGCMEGLPAGLSAPLIGLVAAMVMTAFRS